MNYETDVIEALVLGIIAKGRDAANAAEADPALRQEARRLEKSIAAHCLTIKNSTQLGSFINMSLQKLVLLSNQLYVLHEKVSPDVQVLLELMTAVKTAVPQTVSRQLSLPLAFVAEQKPVLLARWQKLEALFKAKKIDPLLVDIAGLPVTQFGIDNDRLTWGDYVWLKRYFVMLEGVDWENPGCTTVDEALLSQLIRLNFNHQRFAGYGYRLLQGKIGWKKGRREKLNELLRYRTRVVQDSPLADHRFDSHTESISTLFCNWIDAEVTLVRQTETDEGEKLVNPFKFRHKFNALCTAFWYKLQNDHGVFEEKVEDLAEKVAFNCSTSQQEDLSEGSQRTKFYTKDRRVLKVIEDILVKMLADVRLMLS